MKFGFFFLLRSLFKYSDLIEKEHSFRLLIKRCFVWLKLKRFEHKPKLEKMQNAEDNHKRMKIKMEKIL